MLFELNPTKGKTEKLEELIAKSLADSGAVCLAGIDENMMGRIMAKERSLNSTTMVASQGAKDFSHEATTGRTRDGMKKYIPMEESFSFANKQKTQMLLSDICVDSNGYFEKKKASKPYQALSKKRF